MPLLEIYYRLIILRFNRLSTINFQIVNLKTCMVEIHLIKNDVS
jgi:hypothetical protein